MYSTDFTYVPQNIGFIFYKGAQGTSVLAQQE